MKLWLYANCVDGELNVIPFKTKALANSACISDILQLAGENPGLKEHDAEYKREAHEVCNDWADRFRDACYFNIIESETP